jgi:Tfp pilus assembly protein PilV
MNSAIPNRWRGVRRSGAALIAVLIALTVATVLFGTLLRSSAQERAAVRRHQHALQAEYLAEGGIELAAARLAADNQYAGETWQVAAGQFGGKEAGRVEIRVEPVEGQPHKRVVQITADYPDDPLRRARESKQITLDVTRLKAAP